MRRYVFFVAMFLLGASHEAVAQPTCTGLCQQQQVCPGSGTTSVSGTVFAPNGLNPLPNVLVYVPNGAAGAPSYGVQPFTPGVTAVVPVSGSPLVQTTTAYDGTFTLTNMPAGTNIPLVMQAGKWRRLYTIPSVAACTNTPLPVTGAQQTRLPQKNGEFVSQDTLPKIAIVTGAFDAVECSLRKFGVSDAEFSDPAALGGTGSVQFFLGRTTNGAGAQFSANTPSENGLFALSSTVNQYDIVMLPCQGSADTPSATFNNNLVTFANDGGRVYATHFNYPWLSTYAPFSMTADWNPSQTPPPDQTGFIDTTFDGGMLLAKWLQFINATAVMGQIPLNRLYADLTGLVAPTQSWLTIDSPATVQFTFNAQVGQPAPLQNGFVLYHDYHIVDTGTSQSTGVTFPLECADLTTTTPQERVLEFDLFALAWTAPPALDRKSVV